MGLNGECDVCAKARLDRVFADIRERREGDDSQLSGQTGLNNYI